MIAGGGTGGHLYPALNLADALKRVGGAGVELLLIGARRGIESRIFPEQEFAYELLPFEPIYRARPWRNWRLPFGGVQALRGLRRVFRRFDPDLVLGTGGYVAGPVVAWARLESRNTAIQEQNRHPGITTRLLARWVDQLHLGHPEALEALRPGPRTQVRVHGNPIRWPESPPDPGETRRSLGLGAGRVLLVSGGSQGARSINRALVRSIDAVRSGRLPELPADVTLLWSTGPDHYEEVQDRLRAIGAGSRVRAVPYIDRMERALAVSDLAVSRAGALALAELCAWGVPSILVPYPHAAADHQNANARVLEGAGAAVVLPDRVVGDEPDRLWQRIVELLADEDRLATMRSAARQRGHPEAARRIAEDLWALMEVGP